jgi:hypothetical protein
MSTAGIIVLIIVVVLALAAGAWFVAQQTRRNRLRRRFGPEYERRIAETGDRMVAERELTALEKRHARFTLRPLTDAERVRYAEQWTVLQEKFVDRPGETVAAAEELVNAVARDRGYPPDGDFDQRAWDMSVEHGPAVGHYRDGHGIRLSHEAGGVSTEELRRALTHYRAMFMSLTGIREDPVAARTGDGSMTTSATRAGMDPNATRADMDPNANRTGMDPNATRTGMDPRAGADGMPMPDERPIADQPRRR